ncbi:MAG: DUF502 domain-containing protein [Nitrospinota bacterium]
MRVWLRNRFIAGLLVILPISITYILLKFIFIRLDDVLKPLERAIFKLVGLPEFHIPGLGIIATVFIVLLVGLITANVVGRKIVSTGDKIFSRLPIIRAVYRPAKQFLEGIAAYDQGAFRRVALIEYPRKGLYVLGFVTTDADPTISDAAAQELLSVFIPTTPNPTSGFLLFVPKNEVAQLDMSVEEGIKLIVSGGIIGKGDRTLTLETARKPELPRL